MRWQRMARTPRAPWSKANPRKRAGKASTRLTPAEKAAAKARARRAGRRYPNLVDNMRVVARKAAKTKTSGRKRAAKSKTGKGASKTASRRTSAVRKTAKSGRKSAR